MALFIVIGVAETDIVCESKVFQFEIELCKFVAVDYPLLVNEEVAVLSQF